MNCVAGQSVIFHRVELNIAGYEKPRRKAPGDISFLILPAFVPECSLFVMFIIFLQ